MTNQVVYSTNSIEHQDNMLNNLESERAHLLLMQEEYELFHNEYRCPECNSSSETCSCDDEY